MPPRGSEGLNFNPILTHYLFLFTSILSVLGWFIAFISQAIATANHGHAAVGSLWFGIFLQLFLIAGVLYTLASDSIAMHRLQISVFGAVAIVFAVQGANAGLFADGIGSLQAMGAGWLVLSMVDILWVLYFTSEDDSLALHIFNSFGTGGLTPPSRRRRPRGNSVHMGSPGNGYTAPYSAGGGIGPGMYDAKINGNGSFHEPIEPATRSIGGGSVTNGPTSAGGGSIRGESTVGSPLIGSGNAGIGAGGGSSPLNSGVPDPSPGSDGAVYKAKALYAYTGSADDPNEITFAKGEILDILDKQGKWWQAKKSDGTVGIAPSNYLQLL